MKVLSFEIFGDYGHFRKFYTTSSPLTFAFPPFSTIAGMLGAICGVDKNDYLNVFGYDKCKIGLKIVNPIRKVRLGINYINTKDNLWRPIKKGRHEPRTQIRVEFLKNPRYRIFVYHENEKWMDKLSSFLKEHKCFFTLSLGLSELIANFMFKGYYSAERFSNLKDEIATPVGLSKVVNNEFIFEENKKYFKERIPIEMNQERIVKFFDDFIFEPNGKTIKCKVQEFYKLESGENIVFF
ncbi:CRISPR-associated protein Cas5, Hmari subtype [Thermodesulfobium narugense DSM 14796]|uniref:CRISPR-associated protein Cas5, Hmari subtype n=1 Tax=Thermodesulfobium narugense DSM 14796 TaxID=747365 RepID=M1E7F9_9BACT|nr:type I-B CRISPR-associated protein Cas5b [Thermodesulfobium narugense]AEE14450.1 CRISPR-associated protein Cas5, Hmari subtype [Thermodesulfobium narugense DSM 14796]